MTCLEVKNLTFSYPGEGQRKILEDISFTIGQGEYVTLCGKSGSGKTTLLRHLKTVLTPRGNRTGKIYFEGRPLEQTDVRCQASRIGYVMQDPENQIVTDKVWHELAFGLESLGCDPSVMRLRVAEMASYFGIQEWFHKRVEELSGGQQQLLNLASIMVMQPKLLILDEPTSQLDPIAASEFLNTIRKINRELRTSILITEHRLEEVLPASDKVVVLERGRMVGEGSPGKIGKILKEQNNSMFWAMPTPLQIYYEIENRGEEDLCPLTIREGADWLEKFFQEKKQKKEEVKKEASQKEVSKEGSKKEIRKERGSKRKKNEPAVEVKDLWFRYEKEGKDVLKGVSFQVEQNSLFAIVGGNGTGKTTVLKSLCRICRPYRGEIFLKGKRSDQFKNRELFQNMLTMLPQDPKSLFVHKTVRMELEEMISSKEGEAELLKMAELCEITDLLDHHPYDLSGGEQQRTALAKVLLTKPEILLLDEPTKGMDSFFKEIFAGILKHLKEKGVTILMVTHDIEFCARYADTVGLFFDGSMITVNTPGPFFSGNSFYTTAANRMSRHLFEHAITKEEVICLCQENL